MPSSASSDDDVEAHQIKEEDVEMREARNNNIDNGGETKRRVYIPGLSRALKAGEELTYEPSAYRMFHTFQTGKQALAIAVPILSSS